MAAARHQDVEWYLKIARSARQAWCAPTPSASSDLLSKDLSPLPRLRHAVVELLEELPMRVTGLGVTEMRMLEFDLARERVPIRCFSWR
jgi:hypothetical protein